MSGQQDVRDLACILAEHVANASYDRIPAGALDSARKSTLDTAGVILGASGTVPSLRGLVDMAMEMGGREESTILGFGGKVPAVMASFVNGAMAHCLDYDDHLRISQHPSSAVVPACLAVAERVGGVSGRDFLTAVALGQDIFIRFRQSIDWKHDWHLTQVLGVFAAAAACGRILRLDQEKLVNAFGIALCQSAGTMELRFGVGSDIGGMYAAFSSKGGVLSALMAQKGIAGIKTCFEGKAGFFQVYFDGKWDRNLMLANLGKVFAGVDVTYKPWPACGGTHAYIDATLDLVLEHDLRPDDIAGIKVFVGDLTENLCVPPEARQKPKTTLDAKFSIPFCVGVAAAHRKVVIGDFIGKGLLDPTVLALAGKVVPVTDSRFNMVGKELPPGLVEITTRAGRTFSKWIDYPRGDTSKPMTWDDLVEKFADCAAYSANPMASEKVAEVTALIRKLDEVEDTGKIVRLLG